VDARSQLVQAHSALMRDVSTFMAKVQKARTLGELVNGLQLKFDLSLAKAKRIAYEAMIPKSVNVINVPGMEAGLLLRTASKIMGSLKKINR
jgi:hypothetical protein